jgi:hypothetical protein
VAEVLSRVKPFRNWSGVKQRASRLGVSRAAERPPEGVAERRRVGYRKTGVERRSHEHVGSYTEAERRAWVAEGCHPSSFRGRGVSNMGGDASSPNRRRNRC